MTRKFRIAIGQKTGGWYPSAGLIIEADGDDWVIESVEPDPDAVWHIDTIHRWTSPQSVLVIVRPATAAESALSAEQERQDNEALVASWMKRR